MTLLEQIQNEAVDGESDLATVLRKCRVLAVRLKNQEFTEWVKHELDGYPNDEIPEYRILNGHAQGNFYGAMGSGVTNVPLLADDINPEEVRDRLFRVKLNEGVASLLASLGRAREQGGVYQVAWPPEAFAFYESSNVADHLVLGQAWTYVSDNMLVGVLDTIRNRILNFILEIMEENPDAGEAPIGSPAVPPERTHQIFQNVFNIHGDVANLAGGSVGSQINVNTVRPGDIGSLRAFLQEAGLPAADITELERAIKREPGIRSVEAGRETSSWWSRTLQKIKSGTFSLALSASEELLKQGIDTFLQQ
jgi:hypothetical protein